MKEPEQDYFRLAVEAVEHRAESRIRSALAKSLFVGPYNGAGVEEPRKEKGPGFAIFIGEWRIGWWKTRGEACEEAEKISDAIRKHPVD